MPAAWTRVSPVVLETLAMPKGGAMLMLTAAKKHLTIFKRSRRAKGAGRPAVKEKFTEVAATTIDIPERSKRNAIVKEKMEAAKLRTNVYYKRSRGKGKKLADMFYELEGKESVGSAIARRGLEKVLVEAPGRGR